MWGLDVKCLHVFEHSIPGRGHCLGTMQSVEKVGTRTRFLAELLLPDLPRCPATATKRQHMSLQLHRRGKGFFGLEVQGTAHHFREIKAGTQAAGHIAPTVKSRERDHTHLCLLMQLMAAW